MAVPTIISMLITSFYNMADTFFVGRINTSATAAVGVIFSLMAIIQAVGFFLGNGSGNYISRKLGEQDTEEASRMAATGFFTAILLFPYAACKAARRDRNHPSLRGGLHVLYFNRYAVYDGIACA